MSCWDDELHHGYRRVHGHQQFSRRHGVWFWNGMQWRGSMCRVQPRRELHAVRSALSHGNAQLCQRHGGVCRIGQCTGRHCVRRGDGVQRCWSMWCMHRGHELHAFRPAVSNWHGELFDRHCGMQPIWERACWNGVRCRDGVRRRRVMRCMQPRSELHAVGATVPHWYGELRHRHCRLHCIGQHVRGNVVRRWDGV